MSEQCCGTCQWAETDVGNLYCAFLDHQIPVPAPRWVREQFRDSPDAFLPYVDPDYGQDCPAYQLRVVRQAGSER